MCCCLEILVKVFIFVVNFIVTILGLAVIAIGSLLVVYKTSLPEAFELYGIVIIVIGCIIFLVAFCGCCGAVGGNQCLLITYIIFTLILTAFSIYIAVVSSNFKETAESTIVDLLNNLFDNADSRETLHLMEYTFSCCGTTGADSYELMQLPIPPTCCQDFYDTSNIDEIINNINSTDTDYCPREDTHEGCSRLIIDVVEVIFESALIISIIVTVIGVLLVILAIYLIACIREKNVQVIAPHYSMSSPYYYGRG